MSEIKTSLGHYLVKELKIATPLIILNSDEHVDAVDKLSIGKLVISIRATAVIWNVDLCFNGEFTLNLPVYSARDWERDLDPEGDFFTFAQVSHIISQYENQTRSKIKPTKL